MINPTKDLIQNPWESQWGAKLTQLTQDNAEVREDLTAIRLAQQTPVRMSTASNAAAAHVAPAHHLSSHMAELDYESIMAHPRAACYVAEFMIKTGLLGQFRNCKVEPEPDPEDTEPNTGIRPEGTA
ncbi:uncharacterized protein N7483_008151 [Penicillium malachiteum]|uniref:uncharacterized protein n=1 Tax=Penicillium malachiteum TaxID=1324776 RepID=UPI002547C159|nr:uncharacterized protein N7483_008151 [Penicillium malachiteum]KAJ5720217.1 hypothetical protein N7483_008151 [Penicillium malachiteum]